MWNIDYIKLLHFNHSITVELDYIKFGFLPIKIIDFIYIRSDFIYIRNQAVKYKNIFPCQ